ncbi:MAG: DUF72 domain-containing protein [Bacteroidetes bacterium]|nr:DUF72 domain-containing protein [Bacteroidota bacterium]MCH7770455.1 DUF72 domain-containing protein [Bacteroidota bacterium]
MIRFGTCSWKYDSWRGILYSDEVNINYLKEYSSHYSTVEIDQWFWSLYAPDKVVLPNTKTVEVYKRSVPEDFLFTIKVPNSITLTHFYNRDKNEPLIVNPYFLSINIFEEFLETLNPIKENIGCLILQFEYLNKQKMNSFSAFQEKIYEFHSSLPNDIPPIGIEIRNPNYLKEQYFELLQELKIINVFLEGYYMPPAAGVYDQFKNYIQDVSIIRLHGPDRKEIEKIAKDHWNKIYIDREKEINLIADMINDLNNKKVDLFVNVNNHFEGSAPLTIKRIRNALE